LAGPVFFVAVFVLEIGAGGGKGGFEATFQCRNARTVAGHAFGSRHENVRQAFVAVDVEE